MTAERFWDRVNKTEGGCWEWTSSLNTGGYGAFYFCGRLVSSHRLSYLSYHPLTIDLLDHPTIFVCHKCDNRKCVNPSHLFLGSHQDNMDDMKKKGKGGGGRKPLLSRVMDSITYQQAQPQQTQAKSLGEGDLPRGVDGTDDGVDGGVMLSLSL